MCGRYATTRSSGELSALLEAYDDTGGRSTADHNVAPTKDVPVARVDSTGRRVLDLARWGLLPPWAKSPSAGARMINARAETVATSRAYARPFARHRCLVPADGWYEWARVEGRKQPYFLTPADGSVLVFAGIWSVWTGADGPLATCSVLTTAAVGELTEVHERMPLLLPPERWTPWLAPTEDPAGLLAPPSPDWLAGLEIRPVGPAVGNVRNNGPELTARVPASPGAPSAETPLF
ncbi:MULTISPECIES: SOS response-associated peptidase [Micromonospora]|uniref:Abasic site processing protein n=1 Tax=Micromonospora yangpuensis TaxID=683228 RepID=A0A1C6V862_9ACTN|nr:SOS response-associated peptidase [Micromonospora yangpuensis]SCL62541.1 Putative SOS response-associated peptidase YedK [Micromonospora yangpuensis]